MSEDDYLNERLAQSIKSLNETEEIASAINSELYNQRGKLERTKDRMDRIDHNLKQCQTTTNNITSIWRNIVNYFSSSSNDSNQLNANNIEQNQSGYSTKLSTQTNSSFKTIDEVNAYEPPTNKQNKTVLLNKISNIKANAMSMGTELDHHNQLIDDITQSINTNDERLKKLDKKITKLL